MRVGFPILGRFTVVPQREINFSWYTCASQRSRMGFAFSDRGWQVFVRFNLERRRAASGGAARWRSAGRYSACEAKKLS